jgi:nucleoside-diphosphate-sugar epimerase
MEFVSLRIARVIGLGIKKTSSPWRAQIFEVPSPEGPIQIPFEPMTKLSLVHAEDVARMLVTLAVAPYVRSSAYNTPAETWEVRRLKEIVEEACASSLRTALTVAPPATAAGSRKSSDFDFEGSGNVFPLVVAKPSAKRSFC